MRNCECPVTTSRSCIFAPISIEISLVFDHINELNSEPACDSIVIPYGSQWPTRRVLGETFAQLTAAMAALPPGWSEGVADGRTYALRPNDPLHEAALESERARERAREREGQRDRGTERQHNQPFS